MSKLRNSNSPGSDDVVPGSAEAVIELFDGPLSFISNLFMFDGIVSNKIKNAEGERQ